MRSTKCKDAKSFKNHEERAKYIQDRATKKDKDAVLAQTIDFGKPEVSTIQEDEYFDITQQVDMSMFLQSGGRAEKSPRKSDRGGLDISIITANQSTITQVGAKTTRNYTRKSVAVNSLQSVPLRGRNRTQKPRTSLPFDIEVAYLNHEEEQRNKKKNKVDRYEEYPKMNF